jgi:hypothetical protein
LFSTTDSPPRKSVPRTSAHSPSTVPSLIGTRRVAFPLTTVTAPSEMAATGTSTASVRRATSIATSAVIPGKIWSGRSGTTTWTRNWFSLEKTERTVPRNDWLRRLSKLKIAGCPRDTRIAPCCSRETTT